MESPFASWMERLRLENPAKAIPDEKSEDAELIAKTGDKHEERFLQQMRNQGRDIASIPKENFSEALELTRQAIAEGREVVYQGALSMDRFAGFTDFIVRSEDGDGYEIWDTKLARTTKPYHLIQLCCYAEMLSVILGRLPETIRVVLGTQETKAYRTADFFHAYLHLKQAFIDQMDGFSVNGDPPLPDPRADHRQWTSHADAWLTSHDHLVQIAGINISQIRKLEAAGIDTMQKLADSGLKRVPKMSEEIFAKVQAQARIQVKARSLPKDSPPPFEIILPLAGAPQVGLEKLPPESPGDVYFDIEGYPLENDGLEYLLGVTHVMGGKPVFKDWWAHDEPGEKSAFEGFIEWVIARWREHPGMHIFHYAPYEVTAMKRLMGKYGTREAEVDTLLRNGVFIDLYRIVRQGLLIGAPSYSLKKVEKLYLPSRDGDVQNAAASIVFYAQWLESGESADWQKSDILKKIRDYNQVDCDSTWLLACWLREKQTTYGIPYSIEGEAFESEASIEAPVPEGARIRNELSERILENLPASGDARTIAELLAHLVEFHRRDNKPMWWAMFERAAMTHDELYDDLACIAGLTLKGEPVIDKKSLVATYVFDPDQETKINGKSKVIMAHCLDAKPNVVSFDASGTIQLKMGIAALNAKLEGSFPSQLSLIPDEFVSPKVIVESIFDIASEWADKGKVPSCLRRLILRQAPHLKGIPSGTPLKNLALTVPAMHGSTLAIQGPPGTGKTYTASRLIKNLIASGKRVGITSNSHKAIVNLIQGVHEAGGDLKGSVYVPKKDDPTLMSIPGIQIVDSNSALARYTHGIIAGTVWLFARPEFAGKLDYLFVDEAGQVSLANVAAMSRATDNLILLGDQNQLPMPAQGTHPGESGASSLVYLLQDHAVVPPDLGVFLETTYRLHPDLCEFISEAFYEGKLQSAPAASNHRVTLPTKPGPVPIETGILFHPVPHTGNTQASDEEIAAILKIQKSLLGRSFTDSKGRTRPLTLADILFVAPYNMQVRRLERALPAGAKVGSVDRFQGQEAPVVIVSLCSSAGEFGSRGLGFILDRNRLNVALSRAQAIAIVVGDPNIASTSADSVSQMSLINVFCKLTDTNPNCKSMKANHKTRSVTKAAAPISRGGADKPKTYESVSEVAVNGPTYADLDDVPDKIPRIETKEQAEAYLRLLKNRFAKPGYAGTSRLFLSGVLAHPILNKLAVAEKHRDLAKALIPFFPAAQERNADARRARNGPLPRMRLGSMKPSEASPQTSETRDQRPDRKLDLTTPYSLFQDSSVKTFKLSASSLRTLKECPRCFWLTMNGIWKRPEGSFPTLPSGMDRILKKHFDEFAKKGTLPPELRISKECKDMKLYGPAGRLRKADGGFKEITHKDEKKNSLTGRVDYLLEKSGKLIVLDFKTRGFPLKPNIAARSQDQLDIYNFLLREAGHPTEDFAFLLFYIPEKVAETGEVIFSTELVKMNIDVSSAKRTWENALAILNGPCPDAGCEWCEGFEIEDRTRTKMDHERRVTCGILLYDLDPLRVFLVRESGVYQKHFNGEPGRWGIPKGQLKKGKSALETALCELGEETGIALDPGDSFEDLGRHPLNRDRDIHAWSLRWLPPADTRFVCSTGKRRFNPKTQEIEFIAEVIDWRIFSGEEAMQVINHRQAFILRRLILSKESS